MYLREVLTRPSNTMEEQQRSVATVVGEPVNLRMIQQLNIGNRIESSLINILMKIFSYRDNRISNSHRTVNENKQNYIPYQKSAYYSANVLDLIQDDNADINNILGEINDWNYYRAYFPYILQPNNDRWVLFVIDTQLKHVYYIDPMIDRDANVPDYVAGLTNTIRDKVLARTHGFVANQWQVLSYHNRFYQLCENDIDNGIYIFAIIYHLTVNCPIYICQHWTNNIRVNIAHWILKSEYLPI